MNSTRVSLDLARRAVPALEGVLASGLPFGVHVEQIGEKVVGQRPEFSPVRFKRSPFNLRQKKVPATELNAIVGYLARSLSAFYALVGALFWKLSFDLRRYRSLLIYLCGSLTLLGGTLCFIDWWEGLPAAWKLWEGPFVIIAASAMLSLSRKIQAG